AVVDADRARRVELTGDADAVDNHVESAARVEVDAAGAEGAGDGGAEGRRQDAAALDEDVADRANAAEGAALIDVDGAGAGGRTAEGIKRCEDAGVNVRAAGEG